MISGLTLLFLYILQVLWCSTFLLGNGILQHAVVFYHVPKRFEHHDIAGNFLLCIRIRCNLLYEL